MFLLLQRPDLSCWSVLLWAQVCSAVISALVSCLSRWKVTRDGSLKVPLRKAPVFTSARAVAVSAKIAKAPAFKNSFCRLIRRHFLREIKYVPALAKHAPYQIRTLDESEVFYS